MWPAMHRIDGYARWTDLDSSGPNSANCWLVQWLLLPLDQLSCRCATAICDTAVSEEAAWVITAKAYQVAKV